MSEQFKRGLKELIRIDPEHGEASIEELQRLCPDFAEYFVTMAFGEIYSRDALDAKTKALVSIANLVALGHCDGFLRTQILGAKNAGCSRDEVIEVMIQSIIYSGFPKALLGLKMAVEVFARAAPASKSKRGSSKGVSQGERAGGSS